MPAADEVPLPDTTADAVGGELARLCRSCGMCCDGSLFGVVGLTGDEVDLARRRRLRVVPRATAFEQPCAALVGGAPGERDCSIYDERPRSCRRFTCRLYERHRREGGPLEVRLAVVRRVRGLVARVEAAADAPLAPDELHELTKSMEEDFARACE